MKFSFTWKTLLQVQDISRDGEFSKWLLSPLDQKFFQELLFKAYSIANQPKFIFLQTKATYFLGDDDNCE